jgi:membrane fusion protein (multidrug efflux system)
MPTSKRPPVFAIVLLLALAAAALYFWQQRSAPLPTPQAAAPPAAMVLPVKTALPQRQAVADTAEAVGSFIADESAWISAEISGRVSGIHFAEGQPVKAGELLVQLEPDEYRAALEQSRAQERLDQLSWQRTEAVRSRNLSSQQDLDEAEARWRQSQALVLRDQVLLRKTELRAPFSGVAGLRRVSPGDYVSAGQALVNVEALDRLKLDFTLPEHYAGRVAAGQTLQARVDAYPGENFTGELYAVDPRLDEQSRSLRLRGRIANAERRLQPGMFAHLILSLGSERQALFVPEHALVGIGSRQYVYRVQDGQAKLNEVVPGMHRDGWVEITQGLFGDSPIVVEGQMKLHDGAAVQVLPGSAGQL